MTETRGDEGSRWGLPRLILRRLGLALLTLLLVSMLVFATAELLPGDLGRTILGPYASEEQVAALNEGLGEDDPAPVRYADWLARFAQGDWGTSAALRQPVRPLVLDRLGRTVYGAAGTARTWWARRSHGLRGGGTAAAFAGEGAE